MKTRKRNEGFTLVEVLLVLLIIGMLATVLVTTLGGTQQKAQKDTTLMKVQKVENMLKTYNMHVGHYPTESEGGLDALVNKPSFDDETSGEKWAGPYAKPAELNDAWGKKLNYEPPSEGALEPKVWSNGPDGQSNTADDIKNFEEAS